MNEHVSLLARPQLPEVAAADRIALGPRSIGVVDALPGAPLAPALEAACTGRVARVRARLRARPGHELLAPGDVTTHPDALLDAAREVIASVGPCDLLLVEGTPLLAATEPRFAILGAPSPSLLALDPDVRGLRGRFDLVLHDFRPGVLARIVAALLPV